MEYILKACLMDNPITVDNKEDKILLPENSGRTALVEEVRHRER
ncbi:hypothetical protein ABQL67_19385 [Bacteroides hominis]